MNYKKFKKEEKTINFYKFSAGTPRRFATRK